MNARENRQLGSADAGQAVGTGAEGEVPAESPSARPAGAEETRRVIHPRRKLSDDQEREVTGLYAETSTPVPEIAHRFGIAESSVYRVAQRHGAPLRGGPRVSAQREQGGVDSSAAQEEKQARRRSQAGPIASKATVPPRAAEHRPRGVVSRGIRKSRGGGGRSFRIRFEVEEVIQAVDIRDALRQARARGIAAITAVNREG